MNEQDVRALVREAIERHLGRPHATPGGAHVRSHVPPPSHVAPPPHPSHVLLQVRSGRDDDDGMCVIEPAVRCTHCGFCQSYGH